MKGQQRGQITRFQMMLGHVAMIAILRIVIISPVFAETSDSSELTFEQGQDAYVAAEYQEADAIWRQLAETGDIEAMFALGALLSEGPGDYPVDDSQSVEWNLKAAELGHPEAQYNLGNAYQKGLGVPKNDEQSVHWWQRAAAQGMPNAAYNLGVNYLYGRGVKQDPEQAMKKFKFAAARGHLSARKLLEAWNFQVPEVLTAQERRESTPDLTLSGVVDEQTSPIIASTEMPDPVESKVVDEQTSPIIASTGMPDPVESKVLDEQTSPIIASTGMPDPVESKVVDEQTSPIIASTGMPDPVESKVLDEQTSPIIASTGMPDPVESKVVDEQTSPIIASTEMPDPVESKVVDEQTSPIIASTGMPDPVESKVVDEQTSPIIASTGMPDPVESKVVDEQTSPIIASTAIPDPVESKTETHPASEWTLNDATPAILTGSSDQESRIAASSRMSEPVEQETGIQPAIELDTSSGQYPEYVTGESRVLRTPEDRYTLQLTAMKTPQQVELFIQQHQLSGNIYHYRYEHDTNTLYGLSIGNFATRENAVAFRNYLGRNKKRLSPPWLRPFADVQKHIRKMQSLDSRFAGTHAAQAGGPAVQTENDTSLITAAVANERLPDHAAASVVIDPVEPEAVHQPSLGHNVTSGANLVFIIGESRVLETPKERYTLQLTAMKTPQQVEQFIQRHQLSGDIYHYRYLHGTDMLYSLSIGNFASNEDANEFREQFGRNRKRLKTPWPRRFADVQDLIRKMQLSTH